MLIDSLRSYHIVLASKSPRRHELLRGMGIEFSIITKEVDESFPDHLSPDEIADFLCRQKAKAFNSDILPPDYLLITADTIVVVGDLVLNKAANRQEAISMLELLSGKTHQVITGICLKHKVHQSSFTEMSEVSFGRLSRDEICWYVDRYQPYDKAGAYGIQEWIGYIGIEKVNGSYFNVVGLPTFRLFNELKKFVNEIKQTK